MQSPWLNSKRIFGRNSRIKLLKKKTTLLLKYSKWVPKRVLRGIYRGVTESILKGIVEFMWFCSKFVQAWNELFSAPEVLSHSNPESVRDIFDSKRPPIFKLLYNFLREISFFILFQVLFSFVFLFSSCKILTHRRLLFPMSL